MKQIVLRNGGFAIVDDEDYKLLCGMAWRLNPSGYAAHYYRGIKNGKKTTRTILMHRLINKTPLGSITDHIDGNRLNNCKLNLRIASPRQNARNSKKPKKGISSKYKGVYAYRKGYRAQIRLENGLKDLGCFNFEEDAALAYNNAALVAFGEFARLNMMPLS